LEQRNPAPEWEMIYIPLWGTGAIKKGGEFKRPFEPRTEDETKRHDLWIVRERAQSRKGDAKRGDVLNRERKFCNRRTLDRKLGGILRSKDVVCEIS